MNRSIILITLFAGLLVGATHAGEEKILNRDQPPDNSPWDPRSPGELKGQGTDSGSAQQNPEDDQGSLESSATEE